MRDLQPNILDDYEHRVTMLIEHHGDEPGFPKMEAYGVSREQLDDYLFDYQAILDSEGTIRAQQTMYGLIALVPVVVASAFPSDTLPWKNDITGLMASVAMGVALAAVVKGVRMVMKRARLKRCVAERPKEARYVEAVLAFGDKNR